MKERLQVKTTKMKEPATEVMKLPMPYNLPLSLLILNFGIKARLKFSFL